MEGIFLQRKALALRPAPHPDRSTSLNNLAKFPFNLVLECNFNSRSSIGYHEFTRLFSTFNYNTDYENPGVVLPVSK